MGAHPCAQLYWLDDQLTIAFTICSYIMGGPRIILMKVSWRSGQKWGSQAKNVCLESGQIDPDGVSGLFKCPDKVLGRRFGWAVGPGWLGYDQVSAVITYAAIV